MDNYILQGESKTVEYKKEFSKTIFKTISAYANYHDGIIIIGISDSGEIIGVKNPNELRLNLENSMHDLIEPQPYYEIIKETIEEKIIIILKVYRGEHCPYLFNNKAYKRSDTSTVQVDRFAYEELILQGHNMSYEELETENQNLSFQSLNGKLRNTLKIGSLNDDIIITLGLKRNDKYNNAAALLSDNNPLRNSKIQLVAYKNNSVLEMKDRQIVENISILDQYDDCIRFFKKHINTREIIDGAYRKTIEEVPLVAYRETIANAILHRDYSKPTDIRVEIFTDRIEIVSPGSLPIGISEQEYYEGRISIPRNRILAEIFLRLKIIEKLATGIRRIKEYYNEFSIKPKFIVSENAILVILPNVSGVSSSNDFSPINLSNQLIGYENKIYEMIKNHGSMTRIEIQNEIGFKKSYTIDILKELRTKNLIVQIGNGRKTSYILNR